MLLALAVILGVIWFLGFAVFHVASAAIHILLFAAVVAAVIYAIDMMRRGPRGRRTTIIAPPV
jgi:hypothetical protein